MAAEDEVVLLRLFQRLSVALLRHHRHMAHAAEVNQTDLLALGLLAVRGPMTVNALGGELELSSAAVSGLVDRPKSLSIDEIKRMRSTELVAGFECSGNSARPIQGLASNGRWTGVPLKTVLDEAFAAGKLDKANNLGCPLN